MSDNIDWLHSPRGVCKVDIYSPKERQEQERKVICFVDVSTLNTEDKGSKDAGGSSSGRDLALEHLEETEIIVIKDTEKQNQSKMEGSVCLFKQAPSNPISVPNWLLNDLQKYALGFQHALSPSASTCKRKVGEAEDEHHKAPSANCYSVYADQLNIDYMANRPQSLHLEMTAANNTNNNQSPSTSSTKSSSTHRAVISPEGECSMDDLSFYVNRLSNLVIQMAHKEIKDKLENGGKCYHYSIYPPSGDKGKNCPRSAVSKIASEMVHDAVEMTSAEIRGTGEEGKEGGRKTFMYSELSNKSKGGDKQMCQRESKEFTDTLSKGLMVYANQVASDMMVSVMRSLKVQTSGKPVPACVVLKRVLLKHTKEIVSDLIDSCLKNLHSVTGVLMTDSDFVSAVKRNLFNHGKQNATDILEAMLKRLVCAMLGEKETKSQSLLYASLKAGSHDLKCKNQSKNQSLEFSTMKAEMKGKDKCKIKSDMSNIVLSLIQKLLNESTCNRDSQSTFNIDEQSEVESKPSEFSSNKATFMSERVEEQFQDNSELDFVSGTKQMNRQFIDQLVESVMKLCLIMAKYSNNREALAELEEQAALANNPSYQVGGPRCNHDGAMSHQAFPGPEVIVNNQCSTSSLQKQLQAVLQWIAASQFNVPMLYFMGDDDGQLEKLPQVSAKAAEKGYSVGDLLQEVMKFAKERQLDEAVGNMTRKQLLDWLLTNL
ncbi:A-kinase anchoring protein 4 [Phyllostomus discolor]|uniref:A-kinase anchoring protein 4 n=1 Tax=Phyllostomus discolor TaxID=89673 RepID=A0A833ZEB0_9CHIR|nr:A-kinase anchoring protein 4 [Phyllostomus discolor]